MGIRCHRLSLPIHAYRNRYIGGHGVARKQEAVSDSGIHARTVAALYIDPRGPYPSMPGVFCMGEREDARTYDGDAPIVAHPPCGPWSKLRHLCNEATLATADCGPRAVEQVRRWGGVLEHPADSQLWRMGATGAYNRSLPRPHEGIDIDGGFTVAVNQVAWGHCCAKPTWLYCVGIDRALVEAGIRTGGTPTHCVCTGPRQLKRLPVASKPLKRRTPPLFAEWLVSLARASRATSPAVPDSSTGGNQ